MHRNRIEKLTLAVFLGFIFAFTFLNIAAEKKEFSENENRVLAPFPSLDAQNIFGGSFDTQFETWFSDHFIKRDAWIATKASVRKTLGAIENNGVYFGKGGRLIQQFASCNTKIFENNLDYIQEFCEDTGVTANVLIVPDPCYAEKSELPWGAWNIDEDPFFDTAAAVLHDQNVIDIRKEMQEDDMYFRTDHHWNAKGAYAGYKAICENVLHKEPNSFTCETVSDDFRGTMYSRSGAFWTKGEEIEKIIPENPFAARMTFEDGSVMDGLYNDARLLTKDKYTYYIDGNHAYTEIQTDVPGNRTAVIVKDSYSHILIPYLASEYSCLKLVDLRYYQSAVSGLLKESGDCDLYVIYSLNTLVTDTSLGMLW